MPKKYIQLLLSINFCLTAIAAATNSDAGSNNNFVVIPDNHLDWEDESPIRIELNEQFNKIWDCLEEMNAIYRSKLLQELLFHHKYKKSSYDESSEEISKKMLDNQFIQLQKAFKVCSRYHPEAGLDKDRKNALNSQFLQIKDCLKSVYKIYNSKKEALSQKEKAFLQDQFKELLYFTYNFTTKNIYQVDESSIRIELNEQFNKIWDCLEEMNAIYRPKLSQELTLHRENKESSYEESSEEISKEMLDNQFIQLQKAFEVCSQYQPEEELDEDSKNALNSQFHQIKSCLKSVYKIYDSKKEALSQKEKVFIQDQLEELLYFAHNFTTENSHKDGNIARVEPSSLNKIQGLLNSYEEEDLLIYPQYEYIINSQEANVSDLLTSSQIENNTQSRFLYFNKSEGLIEIQHTDLSEDGEHEEIYTTTWKIRPADVNLVKNWQEDDLITIDKTRFFLTLTMRGESLQYTLNNNKQSSVRANFVCKSSNQNTYTILSIDYLENIVVLKNGPCLFGQDGDLKEWHAKDTVVLQKSGSATDPNNPHELINKTRGNEKIWIFLKKRF